MNRIANLLDAIARPRCIECNRLISSEAGPLCVACHRRLPWWRKVDGCPRCGTPSSVSRAAERDGHGPAFEGCSGCFADGSALHVCRALVRYQDSVRRWIPGFKAAHGPFGPGIAVRLAIDHLATELGTRIGEETPARPDLIASVPLHPRRRRQRGFNHADPIAHRIARILERPWRPDALERIYDTPAQATLEGRERRENVRGAFRASDGLGEAPCVWLVDDVLTTGSTLDAAADALLEAGVLEVRGLTLAATLPVRRASRPRPTYHAAAPIGRSHGSK